MTSTTTTPATERPLLPVLTDEETWRVICADSLQLLKQLPDHCIDAVVTDPPYGIDFQGEDWDGTTIRQTAEHDAGRPLTSGEAFQHWTRMWATELARVVKPGGHIACFAAPRMAHRLTTGLEDAGLEIRDVLMWLYGTGMPKSRHLPEGRGTALKPAYEPIVLARTPLDGTTAHNLHQHGTGALNTTACAIRPPCEGRIHPGRWPANVLLSHADDCRPGQCAPGCPARDVDQQRPGASRFFYCAKASRRERDAGLEHLPTHTLDLFPNARTRPGHVSRVRNPHPTVKPLALMRWLVRLATPEGGLVLDPFSGSGSTGVAAVREERYFLGLERQEAAAHVAGARLAHEGRDFVGRVRDPCDRRPCRAR